MITMDEIQFSHTACPKCGADIVVVDNDFEWQYICPCGAGFMLKKKEDDVEE